MALFTCGEVTGEEALAESAACGRVYLAATLLEIACPFCRAPLAEGPCEDCEGNAEAWRREMLALDRALPEELP
jgi:hypothetical protein